MSNTTPTPDAAQLLADYVRQRGGRHTQERAAVARLAAERPGLWTCADLCASPELETFKVARATVYNTVGLMVELGLLRSHYVGEGAALYEARGAEACAVLMVCSHCGAVKKAATPDGIAQALMAAAKAWSPESADVVVRGVCPACRRRERRRKKAQE